MCIFAFPLREFMHSNEFVQISFADEGPGAVRDCALGYDQDRDRLYIFGGKNGSILDDTWYYDFASKTWGKPNTAQSPEHRFTMAFGVWDKSMYISTGEGPGKVFYNDVWRLVNVSFQNRFYKVCSKRGPGEVACKPKPPIVNARAWARKKHNLLCCKRIQKRHTLGARDRAEPV